MSGRDSSRNSSDSEIRETGQNVRSIPLTSATAAGIGNKESAVSSSAAKKKILEVERMAEIERQKRQKELEDKNIEEEANKRIEELVAKRVEEELERRREEIEAEVLRRVEEAKKIMEAKMMEEMERRKQEQLEEARRREVRILLLLLQIRITPYAGNPDPNPDDSTDDDSETVRVVENYPQKMISLEDDYYFP